MDETSKSRARRSTEGFDLYLQGSILDIGCGDDKITPDAVGFDVADGDAQKLAGVADASYDTVYSSHCLEHMRDPLEALLNWWRVVKPGGYLIVAVPDEDLYEQRVWPSVFNSDHKWTFTISKETSWSPVSRRVVDLVGHLAGRRVVSIRTIDTDYDRDDTRIFDRTRVGAEAHIEFIIQKLPKTPARLTALDNAPVCQCGGLFRFEGFTPEMALSLRCISCGLSAECVPLSKDEDK